MDNESTSMSIFASLGLCAFAFKRFLVFLALLCSLIFCFCAAAEPPTLTFQHLSGLPDYLPRDAAIWYLQNKLVPYHQQEVRMRGFLYQTSNGEWIFSAEPNLKSCCVGKANKVAQQIAVSGLTDNAVSSAVLLQGHFTVDPQWDSSGQLVRLYHLKGAHIVSNTTSWPLIFLTGLGVSGIVLLFLLLFNSIKKGKCEETREGAKNSENPFRALS